MRSGFGQEAPMTARDLDSAVSDLDSAVSDLEKLEVKPKDPNETITDRAWQLEIEKLRMQAAVEKARLGSESSGGRWSVAIPVLAAIITAGATTYYGFWSTRETAKIQFRQKAAEIIMQAPTTADMVGRARYLTQIFPELAGSFQLPAESPKVMPKYEQELRQALHKELSRTLTPEQSLALWQALFSGDGWAREPGVVKAISSSKKQDSNPPAAD
jgi:hypothetical protein